MIKARRSATGLAVLSLLAVGALASSPSNETAAADDPQPAPYFIPQDISQSGCVPDSLLSVQYLAPDGTLSEIPSSSSGQVDTYGTPDEPSST